MANVAFITTKKHIKSYNVLEIFQIINKEKFDEKLSIESEGNAWHINYNENYGINFSIYSPKRIGSKHHYLKWWNYVMLIL